MVVPSTQLGGTRVVCHAEACRGNVITLIVPYLGVSTFLGFGVPRLYDVVRH